MDLLWHKVICSILLLISAFLGYLFPAIIKKNEERCQGIRNKNGNKVLPTLSAFGAGAFIALAIVHLIPDAIEESNSGILTFKIANVEVNSVCYFILVGFLISLLCESIVDEFFHDNSHKSETHKNRHHTANTKDNINSNVISTNVSSEYSSDEESCIINTLDVANVADNREHLFNKDQKDELISNKKQNYSSSEIIESRKGNSTSFSIGFVLVSALFLHSLFEGMVVGTSKNVMGTWLVTSVIFAHKWIEILIVFITLSTRRINPIFYVILLAISSPLGAMIGAIVILSNSVASAVCSALAAGTILYVACIEVIPEVFNEKHNISIIVKLISFVMGISIVSVLTLAGDIVENSF